MTDKVMANGERRPVPDPSTLTTEQLLREVDRAVTLLQAELEGDRQTNVVHFNAIEREFAMIEDRRKEQKADTKMAVDAALLAADKSFRDQTTASEKAIAKSETSTMDQTRQQNATIVAELKAVVGNVSDMKGRIGTIEAIKLGAMETRTTQRLDVGTLISIAMFVIVLLGVFATFISRSP